MVTERKKGSMGAARSELVAVRFDPATKFFLDIGARVQRRSAASFVEEAVLAAIARQELDMPQGSITLKALGEELWDVDSTERLVNMWLKQPQLLSYDEQTFLKYVRDVFPAIFGREFIGDAADRLFLRSYRQLFDRGLEEGLAPAVLVDHIAEAGGSQLSKLVELLKDMDFGDYTAIAGFNSKGRMKAVPKPNVGK